MYTVEQEVCIGLAFTYACDRRRMLPTKALRWAKQHWMEFFPQMDTDTGRMLLQAARDWRENHPDKDNHHEPDHRR